jgi:uncharacterized alpha-E superfamily protein
MLCRVADDMFWMSRYVERAIAVSRLIDVTSHLELDAGELLDGGASFWRPLLGYGGAAESVSDAATPEEVRAFLSEDNRNPNSLISCIRQARSAAQRVRESISSEMWEQINGMHLGLTGAELESDTEPHAFYRSIREGAQLFQGLADSTLAHDEPWAFVSLGTFLERADGVARLLRLEAHLLTETTAEPGDVAVRWLAVLRSCGSAEAYARYYSLRVEPARVLEFLLLNPVFPQSVRFSLTAARAALAAIASQGGSVDGAAATRAMGRLCALLENAAVDEILDLGLREYLADVRAQIVGVADQITRTYLREQLQPATGGVARAAVILAQQQQ